MLLFSKALLQQWRGKADKDSLMSFLCNIGYLRAELHKCCLYEFPIELLLVCTVLLAFIFTFNRKIGPRTLVWAEKELVDKSAYEFSEVSN